MLKPFALAFASCAFFLSACGGGNDEVHALAAPQSAVISTEIIKPAQVPATDKLPFAAPTPSATDLMNWAQRQYPQFFPSAQENRLSQGFTYRYFPTTGNYLGISGNKVYILGSISGGALTQVGTLNDFACNVFPDSCGLIPASLLGIPQSSIVLNTSSTIGYAKLTAGATNLVFVKALPPNSNSH